MSQHPSDTARFRAVSVPSYEKLFQPQPTHISVERQQLLSPKIVSFSQIFHKALTVAILAQTVPKKCAHPRTRFHARVVESHGHPGNFRNSLLKTSIPNSALFRNTENPHSKCNFCTVELCKTARECERESLGFSVKHTTGTWATCSRPGPGNLVQARTFRLACISEIPFHRICLLNPCPP